MENFGSTIEISGRNVTRIDIVVSEYKDIPDTTKPVIYLLPYDNFNLTAYYINGDKLTAFTGYFEDVISILEKETKNWKERTLTHADNFCNELSNLYHNMKSRMKGVSYENY